MNRREFMNRLDSCLICIERGEREAALRYYEEYFDDAGPDREGEVISSLGSPEALAREIIAQAGEGKTNADQPSAAAERSPEAFHSIKADIINANLTITKGNEWRVDLNYPDERTKPEVSITNGVLRIIEEHRRLGHFLRIGGWKPGRIDIIVPDVRFRDFKIEGVNGAIVVQDIAIESIACETINGTVELSGIRAQTIHGESVNGSVAITSCQTKTGCKGETVNGSVRLGGELRGDIRAQSVNGALNVKTSLPITEYNIDVENITGSVRINGEKHRKEVHIMNGAKNSMVFETVNGGISLEFGV